MQSPNFEQAREYVVHRLERELSPHLVYHRSVHTWREVVPVAETLARIEGIPEESLSLLLTAAWFHDIGFIDQALNHELISTQISKEVLPSFGYTEDQVEILRRAILAITLPQSPTYPLGEILIDADLDTLRRENLMQHNEDSRRELAYLGKEFTDKEWQTRQLKLIEAIDISRHLPIR